MRMLLLLVINGNNQVRLSLPGFVKQIAIKGELRNCNVGLILSGNVRKDVFLICLYLYVYTVMLIPLDGPLKPIFWRN